MATKREILLEAALFEIDGIVTNAIAPHDDSADAKLDRIMHVIWGNDPTKAPVAKAMLAVHDEQRFAEVMSNEIKLAIKKAETR